MTGGGFGGCTVNLVQEQHATEFGAKISERFQKATGITPQIYICSAEDGAQVVTEAA
jgi:galactokinase